MSVSARMNPQPPEPANDQPSSTAPKKLGGLPTLVWWFVIGLANAFVFDIDDLESVISSNIREREREAERAELIVESEIMQFQQTLRVLDIGPTIGALRNKMQDIARVELTRQRNRLGPLTPEQETAIEALLVSTVNKISHPLLSHMRRSYDASDAETIQAWRDIFGLEE